MHLKASKKRGRAEQGEEPWGARGGGIVTSQQRQPEIHDLEGALC